MGFTVVPLGKFAASVGGDGSVGANDFTESTSPLLASLVTLTLYINFHIRIWVYN